MSNEKKGFIAQSVEQSAFNRVVVGSSPTGPTESFFNVLNTVVPEIIHIVRKNTKKESL